MAARPIYLDNHATTRVDPRVVEAMLPFFTEAYGNAASISHSFGWEAADAVEEARSQIAGLLNALPKEIIFTSGATEANNLAIKGVLQAAKPGSHFITNAAEHRAVLDPAKRLRRSGHEVTILPVDLHGRVSPDEVADAIQPNTVLVSMMWANNEVGTIQPVAEIGKVCRQGNVLFHCDAVQTLGKLPIDLSEVPVDLLSVTSHKLYGPKGIGALYVRRRSPRTPLTPLFDGGGHEQQLRSGTLPVPLLVGFGECCRIAAVCREEEGRRVQQLRDEMWGELSSRLDGLQLNGDPESRLAGNLNFSVEDVDGDVLMTSLKEVAVSSGSACTSANPEPSHVLRAMGVSDRLTRASLRLGFGRFNTEAEVKKAADYLCETIERVRSLSE